MRHLGNWIRPLGLTLAIAASGLAQRGSSPPILPDRAKTPGDALDVTKDDVCVPGYSKKVRNVTAEEKRQVYAEYGITSHGPGEYEIDHLISLELGGSNSIRNLWPQSYKTSPWNAHVKDKLEDRLHAMVCSGQIDLKAAQRDIATDWIAAYKRVFGSDQPVSKRGSHSRRSAGGSTARQNTASADKVWVNTRSGKYFLPGSRYYGKTREGQYMSESEAQKQGYVAAKGH